MLVNGSKTAQHWLSGGGCGDGMTAERFGRVVGVEKTRNGIRIVLDADKPVHWRCQPWLASEVVALYNKTATMPYEAEYNPYNNLWDHLVAMSAKQTKHISRISTRYEVVNMATMFATVEAKEAFNSLPVPWRKPWAFKLGE
jgi:hypothetical protein